MPYLPPYQTCTDDQMIQIKIHLKGEFSLEIEKINRIINRSFDRTSNSEDQWGCVYLIQSDLGACKIGKSNNPDNRLKELQTSHWTNFSLEYVAKVRCPHWYESALHRYLKPFHLKREWFSLHADVIAAETKLSKWDFIWMRYAYYKEQLSYRSEKI